MSPDVALIFSISFQNLSFSNSNLTFSLSRLHNKSSFLQFSQTFFISELLAAL